MNASTRRAELLRRLIVRRQDTVGNLAAEFCVCEKTICRDLVEMIPHYPLKTVQGNGGGVFAEEWYHPTQGGFTEEECTVLRELLLIANPYQQTVVIGLLNHYGAAVR